jgi:hypothetical protein
LRSTICAFPNSSGRRGNVDGVCGYWIHRNVYDSSADIRRADECPTRASEWLVRLLGLLTQGGSLSSGSLGRSNGNSAVSHALSDEPILRRTFFLSASRIDSSQSLTWVATFSIRAKKVWKTNQWQRCRQQRQDYEQRDDSGI